MPTEEELNFQNELRASQTAARSQTEEEPAPEEEEPTEEPETLETPEQERAKGASLASQKMQILAQKAAAKATKTAGRVQQAGSFVLQRVGSILVSFGLGTGITIIGLIVGLPLLIIGVGFLAGGLIISISAKATVLIGQTMEKQAKAEEKKIEKAQGGKGAAKTAKEALETVETVRKYASFIAGPFIYIGCTILGFLSGLFFLIMLAGAVMG